MYSAFWFGFNLDDFLFKGLSIHSSSGMVLLCFALTGLSVAFEGLKVLHAEAKIRSVLLSSRVRSSFLSSQDSINSLVDTAENVKRKRLVFYLLEICLYVVQVILGYLLMLSVMTYNGYVSLAILMGVAVGYAIFGRILAERRMKNTQLTMPCQQCLQTRGQASTEVTILEDDASSSGCCSRPPQDEKATEY